MNFFSNRTTALDSLIQEERDIELDIIELTHRLNCVKSKIEYLKKHQEETTPTKVTDTSVCA